MTGHIRSFIALDLQLACVVALCCACEIPLIIASAVQFVPILLAGMLAVIGVVGINGYACAYITIIIPWLVASANILATLFLSIVGIVISSSEEYPASTIMICTVVFSTLIFLCVWAGVHVVCAGKPNEQWALSIIQAVFGATSGGILVLYDIPFLTILCVTAVAVLYILNAALSTYHAQKAPRLKIIVSVATELLSVILTLGWFAVLYGNAESWTRNRGNCYDSCSLYSVFMLFSWLGLLMMSVAAVCGGVELLELRKCKQPVETQPANPPVPPTRVIYVYQMQQQYVVPTVTSLHSQPTWETPLLAHTNSATPSWGSHSEVQGGAYSAV